MEAEEDEEEEGNDDADDDEDEEGAAVGEPRLKLAREGGRTPLPDCCLEDLAACFGDRVGVEGPSEDEDFNQFSGFNLLKKEGSLPDDIVRV